MRWWRWVWAFLSNQAALASLLVEVEADRDRLAALLRREKARRESEAGMFRTELAAARREIESLSAANETLIVENQQERAWSNTVVHRNAAGFQFADRLPPDVAADLRGCLSPAFPAMPEEAAHAR